MTQHLTMKFKNNVFKYIKYIYSVRSCCNGTKNEVRVRFAPSPTGELHLGGLRTALYNYLLAHSLKGKFILRIEDTDKSRNIAGAADGINSLLHWAGIIPDESPYVGGPYGPYVQSERKHIYQNYAHQLLKNNLAYRCYCSEQRLEAIRTEQLKKKLKPGYDGKCCKLSDKQCVELENRGVQHCIRLKLVSELPTYTDGILGDVGRSSAAEEGDPVLLKADGGPTYLLASVVDDHLMNISHVLRGVEWHTATPKHLLLYKYLGWTPPHFSHLPLLLNKDGSKLSKRNSNSLGNITVQHFKNIGYSPTALINSVIGSGISDRDYNSLYTLQQLQSKFSLSQIKKSAAKFDKDHLSHFNRLDLHQKVAEQPQQLGQELLQIVLDHFGDSTQEEMLKPCYLHRVIQWTTTRPVDRLTELLQYDYLWTLPSAKHFNAQHGAEQRRVVEYVMKELSSINSESFTEDRISECLKRVQVQHNIKKGTLMKVLRTALCEGKQGATITSLLGVFGKEQSLWRLGIVSSPIS